MNSIVLVLFRSYHGLDKIYEVLLYHRKGMTLAPYEKILHFLASSGNFLEDQ